MTVKWRKNTIDWILMHFNSSHYQFRNIHTVNGVVKRKQSELTEAKNISADAFVNKSINTELFTIIGINWTKNGPSIMKYIPYFLHNYNDWLKCWLHTEMLGIVNFSDDNSFSLCFPLYLIEYAFSLIKPFFTKWRDPYECLNAH